jgi:hypothetical protein
LGGTVKQAMMGPDSEVQTASITEGDVVFSVESTVQKRNSQIEVEMF